MSTLTVNIDTLIHQKAQERAITEGKLLDQVVEQLLGDWTKGWVSKAPAATPYTVKPGDTLAQIALKMYGDAKRYIDIARVNNITNPSMIRVGHVLLIPPLSALSGQAAVQPVAPAPQPVAPTPQPVAPKPAPAPVGNLQIEYIQSPHYNSRPANWRIWCIVVHSTANSTLEGVIRWFTDPQSFVSAHYNIGKDGRIVQMVQDELRAWHAGKSEWKGVHNVNDYSIGIELVNKNDGVDPYPEAQYKALVLLCKKLMAQYGVQPQDVVGHKEISLSGKSDPAGFDLNQFRRDLGA